LVGEEEVLHSPKRALWNIGNTDKHPSRNFLISQVERVEGVHRVGNTFTKPLRGIGKITKSILIFHTIAETGKAGVGFLLFEPLRDSEDGSGHRIKTDGRTFEGSGEKRG